MVDKILESNKNSQNVPHPALKGGALRGTFFYSEFLEQKLAHLSAGL